MIIVPPIMGHLVVSHACWLYEQFKYASFNEFTKICGEKNTCGTPNRLFEMKGLVY